METPLPGSTPEGNFSSDPHSEKESALSRTLRRLGLLSESKEQDDDEEETEEKPKKFRRFFKGLFKNVVTPPTDSEAQPPKRFDLEALLGGTPKPEENIQEVPQAEQSDISEDLVSTIEAATPLETQPSAERAHDEDPIPLENVEDKSTSRAETPEPEVMPEVIAPTPESTYSTPLVVEQGRDRTVFERNDRQPVEKEVVIERGAGMALPVVLVGAEYLARKKADRKLDAKYNEKVTTLETENKRTNVITEQLDTLVRQNREQLETLKRERGIITPDRERRPEPHIERPGPPTERVQQVERPKPYITLESQPQPTPEKPEDKETYKIMEQVAEAAEQNVPVEMVFERSHEVKDDQTTPVGAASVGAIMAAKAQSQQIPSQSQTGVQPTDTSGLPVAYDKPGGEMYKQAMQRGFWAGVIIIILGTLAYLLK